MFAVAVCYCPVVCSRGLGCILDVREAGESERAKEDACTAYL